MAKRKRQARPRSTRNEIETVTLELDTVRGHIRRALERARREADELAELAQGVQEALAEVSAADPAEEVRRAAALARVVSGGLLSGAARLRSDVVRVETLTTLRP